VIAAHGHPISFLREGSREELRKATGDTTLPCSSCRSRTIIPRSRAMLAWTSRQCLNPEAVRTIASRQKHPCCADGRHAPNGRPAVVTDDDVRTFAIAAGSEREPIVGRRTPNSSGASIRRRACATLAFEVRNDVGYGGMRWITVGPAEQPGTSIVLSPPAVDPGLTDGERRTIVELAAAATGTTARRVPAPSSTFRRSPLCPRAGVLVLGARRCHSRGCLAGCR
jgi:hypothetical protein